MARGSQHGEEVRAQVMAALLAGQGVPEVASTFHVPERTIRKWREAEIAEVCRVKKERIFGLILDFLEANLACLVKQYEVFSDRAYIEKQPASEAAVLHGVIADKGHKVLEGLERAGAGSDSDN